ncbi:MAG TPA: DUF2252 family protein [Candidatus Dormibacteraeota bacterium]
MCGERTCDLSSTRSDQLKAGKEARRRAPRASHARWDTYPGRPDPVTVLEEQAKTRVPELVPIRYGRMVASPFAFFRGTALLMASDLAHTHDSGRTHRRRQAAPTELKRYRGECARPACCCSCRHAAQSSSLPLI